MQKRRFLRTLENFLWDINFNIFKSSEIALLKNLIISLSFYTITNCKNEVKINKMKVDHALLCHWHLIKKN